MMFIPDYVAERAKLGHVIDTNGCHVSKYSTGSHGYAQIGWNVGNGRRKCTTAHRASWVSINGQISEGMTIDHICKNRRCVNVDHLRLLTNFENARRTDGRDWEIGQCINGHPNDFLHTAPNGRTRCDKCKSDYRRAHRTRKATR